MPTNGTYKWSPGLIVGATCLFFEPGPFPGLPGPALGPEGPKIDRKSGAGFIVLSSLRSAQMCEVPNRSKPKGTKDETNMYLLKYSTLRNSASGP